MAFNREIEEPGKGPLTEGDGKGIGNTLGPDVAEEDRTYDPSDLEVTRGRQQGLGVGARDLAKQRDPGRPAPAEDEK